MAAAPQRAADDEFTRQDAEAHAAGVAERRALRVKEKQHLLDRVICTSGDIDWEKLREFLLESEMMSMHGEGLNPNFTHPTTLVATIHQACTAGHKDILEWCLDKRADVNCRTALGRSPLHHACDSGRTAITKILLGRQADPNQGSLSFLTPLHIACQSSNYDVVNLLLSVEEPVIDVDAEDTSRRTPESLTQQKNIHRAIRKYRERLVDRRREVLQEQALRRLFQLFDIDGDQWIWPEELIDTQSLLAQYFDNVDAESIEETFAKVDANSDGRIDWDEFRASYADLLEGLGASSRDVLNRLCEIESQVFQQRVRQMQAGDASAPVLSHGAQRLASTRPARKSALVAASEAPGVEE